MAAAFAFAFHDGFERVDVGPANFVHLLDLNGEPIVGEEAASAGLVPTGKMRPSIPMSPTWTLLGIPPSPMTAKFLNSHEPPAFKCGNVLGIKFKPFAIFPFRSEPIVTICLYPTRIISLDYMHWLNLFRKFNCNRPLSSERVIYRPILYSTRPCFRR